MGEHYGKTPSEFLDMDLDDFTLAFNAWAMLMQARSEATEQGQRDMAHNEARRAMKESFRRGEWAEET